MILPDLSATNVQKTKKQRADNVVSLDLRLFTSAMLGWELRRATLSAKRNRFPHGVLLGKWWYPWDGTFNNQPQFPYDVLEFRRISFIHYLDTTTQYEASKTYWNTTSFWKAQRQPFSSEKNLQTQTTLWVSCELVSHFPELNALSHRFCRIRTWTFLRSSVFPRHVFEKTMVFQDGNANFLL